MEEQNNEEGLAFDKEFEREIIPESFMPTPEIIKLRSQACLKCLKCCSVVMLPVTFRDQEEMNFYGVKGFEFFMMAGRMWTVIHKKCQHLTPLGCKIYDKRPAGCRNYDARFDSPLMTKACLWWNIKEDPMNKLKGCASLEDAPKKEYKEFKK